MKTLMKHLAAGAILVALASPVYAQNESANKITHLVKSESVTGAQLWDFHGTKIGRITDVMLAPFHNLVFVLVDVDELGEEDHKVVVPWKKIHVKPNKDDADELVFALDADKEKLKNAPGWDEDSAVTLSDRTKVLPIYRFWEIEMDVEPKRSSDAVRE